MNRRYFLGCAAALTIGSVLFAVPVLAGQTLTYSPGLIKQALAQGKTVFVDYSAVWCSTCAVQERVMNRLRAENPAYDVAMIFIKVDWDTYRRQEVTTSRNIPRRSTLIVLRGEKELGRIVAGTSTSSIRQLMDKGLKSGA